VKQSKVTGYVLAAIGMLLFSFTLVAVKLGLESFTPVVMSFGRVIPVSLVCLIALKLSGKKLLPPKEDLHKVLGLTIGVVIAFPAITSFSLQHVTAGEAGIIGALGPIIAAALAVLYGHKHPGKQFWFAAAIGTVATIVFALTRGLGQGGAESLFWYAALLVSVSLWSWGQVTGGSLTNRHHSIHILAWAILLATPLNAAIAGYDLLVANPITVWPTASAWFGFLFVSFISMFLAFFIWYAAMDRIGAVKTTVLQLAQPILTLIWGILLIGEQAALDTWIAAIVIMVAVGYTQRAGRNSSKSVAVTNK
jgi:drug/metabolite transporter (DMT)-like permease